MSAKRPSEMKEAFKRLQVQSPYKLPKSGVGFTPPRTGVSDIDDIGAPKVSPTPGQSDRGSVVPPVTSTPRSENQGNVLPEVKNTHSQTDPWSEKPAVVMTNGLETQRVEEPVVVSTSGLSDLAVTLPKVENTVGVLPPEVISTSGEKDPEVDGTPESNPPNCLDSFLPQGRGPVSWREKGSGSLHIPHQLFEFAQKATSSRNELLIFNCLIRFSLGFRRTSCEAGYSFIAQWTGIEDSANVRKSVKSLLASGLIVKIREADSVKNIPAVYEVPVVAFFLDESVSSGHSSGGGTKNFSRPVVESTSGQTHRAPHGRNNSQPEVKSTTKKEKKKKTLNKAADPIILISEEPENPEERKRAVAEAIQKFELALPVESQSEYLIEFERMEFPHGFLPPKNIIRNMAVLHWLANRGIRDNRVAI